MANQSDICQSLKEDLRGARKELDVLVRRAPFVTDPDEKRLLAQDMSRLRQDIRELQHAVSIACAAPPPPLNVSITGVEQTQATQFFESLLSPCPDRPGQARCQNNDIPLAAGKTTVFRVYTNVLAHPTQPITALTGVLQARPAGTTGLPVGLTPYNGPLPPRPKEQISRKNVNDTLNFRLPAAMCHGQVEVRLNVYDALHPAESGFSSQTFLRTLDFVQTATLKIRLVRIHYANAARVMDIPAPTTADFWTTAQYTLKTYPIPGIDVVRDSVELYDGDFSSFFASAGPGAQGTTGTIFDILTNLRNAENLSGDVHYLAIIPGPPANRTGASGWAISRRQIAEVNGPTMAQEIGHDSGFPHHAPGCGAGDPDPNYPVYDGYPAASIGEFGFDTVVSAVFDPAVTADFMSYCGNPWVSPYTYLGLLNTFQSAARIAGSSALQNQEVLTAAFSISSSGKVGSFQSGFPRVAPSSPANGEATPFAVELHDESGNPIVRERLRLTSPYQSLDDAQLDFSVGLPWRPNARAFVIKRDDQVVHTQPIGKSAPTVELKPLPRGPERSGKIPVSWVASGTGKGKWRYTLRYSNDNGQTWFALANLTATEHTVDLDQLPGGDQCLLQVLCAADMRAGVATSAPFAVPMKANAVEILTPHNGDVLEPGQPVSLFGFSHSAAGSGNSDGLNWSSSIDGFLGSGAQVIVAALTPGRHRITLAGEDGLGGEISTSIYVTVPRGPLRE
jgi:hypothetical protein